MVIALIIVLLLVLYQDLKYRHIHILAPILILVLSSVIFYKNNSMGLQMIVYNNSFLLITLVVLMLYMNSKNKSFINPFKTYFGIGDLVFFMAITPLFLLFNYILYFVLAMIFSIILQLTLVKFMKHKSVPLAGFAALFLIIVIVNDIFLSTNKLTIIS